MGRTLLVALCGSACGWIAAAQTSVQESGLRSCFDAGGTEIVCTGTGQDGDLRPGAEWPVPRLVDQGDGTVTDRLTGLMWLKDAGCLGPFSWLSTFTVINNLNTGNDLSCAEYSPGAYDDWRVPNVVELATLIDYGSASGLPADHPFLDPGCPGVFATWSSTTNAVSGEEDEAWTIAHAVASIPEITATSKTMFSGCLWPVRHASTPASGDTSLSLVDGGIRFADDSVQETAALGAAAPRRSGQTDCWTNSGNSQNCANSGQDGDIQAGVEWPVPRYVDNGDGTVADELTGLTWLKDAECLGDDRSFDQAQGRVADINSGVDFVCTDYVAGSFDDWRVPAIGELVSLLDYGTGSGLPTAHPFDFGGLSVCGYWSSTSDVGAPSQGWRLVHGPTALLREVQSLVKSADGCVWLVRDGS